jgi:hypothetical protein
MKFILAKSVRILFATLVLSSCLANPGRQSNVSPTAEIISQNTATPLPTSTSSPSAIYSNSPDNKYTVELALSETPIKLTVLDNVSKQTTQVSVSDRYYNKIEGDGSKGLKWFTDNKVFMFDLYREPYPEKVVEDFSCFFAIDVEQAKLLTTHCSSIGGHIWTPDKPDVVIIEHGGLNDIFDYYFPETNCYKVTLDSECENSNILIEGTPLK